MNNWAVSLYAFVVSDALRVLWGHKLRSFLTLLGVIIGVSTVVGMVSVIEGINRYVYGILGAIGSRTVYVQKFNWLLGFGQSQSQIRELARRKDLTMEDAKAIASLPAVEMAVAYRNYPGNHSIYGGGNSLETSVVGATEGAEAVFGLKLAQGRGISREDVIFRKPVAVLGASTAEGLFPEGALGKTVKLEGRPFLVVGVLERRGGMAIGGDVDNMVIIPISVGDQFLRSRRGPWSQVYGSLAIGAMIREGVSMEEAKAQIRELMRMRRGLGWDREDDFALNTQDILVSAYKQITTGIFLAMMLIASMALLVGGIGIMNIMLVSVAERTREIGIRMAIGATRRQILFQFLTEAVVLTTLGGLVGVFFGFVMGKLVDLATPLPSSSPVWVMLLGLGFSGAVGLFFGIYPAYRASRLNPIEALRYE